MKRFLKGSNMLVWLIIFILGGYVLVKGISLFVVGNEGIDLLSDLDYSLNQKAVEVYMPGLTYSLQGDQNKISLSEKIVKKAFHIAPLGIFMQENESYATEVENTSSYEKILASEASDENEVDENGKLIGAAAEENMEASTTPIQEFSIDKLRDYDYLINNFYQIDKTTTINSAQLNIDDLLSRDMKMQISSDSPQILIYHTHSQEAYVDSTPGDANTTVVGVGAYLAELLTAKGYHVIHHTGVYDMNNGKLDRNKAYTLAGNAIEQILAENPSIEVVIDLHRDGVAETTHLVTEINGKPTAQFMFFNGLSRTTTNGDIEYLANPNINDNLAFSLQMQLKTAEYYPGAARKIYLKGYRYNLHYRAKSLLVECGAQTNTVEEAKNAMEPLSDCLDKVLSGK